MRRKTIEDTWLLDTRYVRCSSAGARPDLAVAKFLRKLDIFPYYRNTAFLIEIRTILNNYLFYFFLID